MDLETKIRENYNSQPMQLLEMNMKSNTKDLELPAFGVPSLQGNFMQDLLHIDPFHVNGSSSNPPLLGVQTPNFVNPFDSFTYGCSSAGFDAYEPKPFFENNVTKGHAHVMDNFQYGGNSYCLNVPHERNQMEMMEANQGNYCVPFDPQEIKPMMNFVVPDDEVSCISPNHSFCRSVGLNNRNNRTSAPIRRPCKLRNKSNVVKGQWTVEEDRLLIQLVEQYGMRKWSHIAQSLPGRIGKQCRERWHNHLRPDIKKDTWSNEEDKILIEAHAEIGNKWAEIAKKLPGRTENSIKNHWNATKRRQYSKRKCRSKYPRPSLLQEYIKSLNLDKNPPIDYRKRSSSSANTNNNNNNNSNNHMTSTKKAAAGDQFCPDNDRLVPIYDFNEVPDFCFDENLNLFQEGCNIDALLDDMPCAPPTMHEGDFEGKLQYCGDVVVNNNNNLHGNNHFETGKSQEMEVKREMDLVEMMSQVNEAV